MATKRSEPDDPGQEALIAEAAVLLKQWYGWPEMKIDKGVVVYHEATGEDEDGKAWKTPERHLEGKVAMRWARRIRGG